jgi:hypothetical protein
MSELNFFLLMGVLTQNFNTMDLVNFFEKNKKLHIQIVAITWRWHQVEPWAKEKNE